MGSDELPNFEGDLPILLAVKVGQPACGSVRYQTLDCWRGFTCILLVLYHSTMHARAKVESTTALDKLGFVLLSALQHLHVGVPIFFVISGYCIMATLDARRRNGESVRLYVWRRFHRIYPPYWIALAFAAVVIGVTERFLAPGLFTRSAFKMTAPYQLDSLEWIGNLSLTESWRFHLTGGKVRYLMGHVWTLCYEEQFYAIAGIILCVSRKRMFLALFILTAIIPGLHIWAYRHGISLEGTIVGKEWFLFYAGIAAYYSNHCTGQTGRRMILALLAVATLLPVFDRWHCVLPTPDTRFNWVFAMLSAFLISAFHQYDRQISSWRLLRPFAYSGRICYSLYLIHPLVTTSVGHAFFRWGIRGSWQTLLVVVPICVALSIISGVVFFAVVERRFLNSDLTSRTVSRFC